MRCEPLTLGQRGAYWAGNVRANLRPTQSDWSIGRAMLDAVVRSRLAIGDEV